MEYFINGIIKLKLHETRDESAALSGGAMYVVAFQSV